MESNSPEIPDRREKRWMESAINFVTSNACTIMESDGWMELYNYKANGDPSVLTDTEDDHPIPRREVEAAVQSLKKGKSAGVDNIPAELGPSRWSGCNHHPHNNMQQDLADKRMANPMDPVLRHHTCKERQPAAVPELPNNQLHQSLKQSHAEDHT